MKKEKMMEYINQLDEQKMEKTQKAAKRITISLGSLIIMITIIIICFFYIIASFFYNEIYLVFSTEPELFAEKLENMYHQEIDIVQTNCDEKGNGTYLLQTKKEPRIEFKAVKEIYSEFETDYFDRALVYYVETVQDPLFENVELIKQEEQTDFENFTLLRCKAYFNIQEYSQIEEASKTLFEIQKFMEKRVADFNVFTYLTIGEYVSPVEYDIVSTIEEGLYREKYEYYWFLKDSKQDTSIFPKEDVKILDFPRQLDVYVNDTRIIDEDQTSYGFIYYSKADYNLAKREYEVNAKDIVLAISKFQVIGNNTNQAFPYTYQGKRYELYYISDKVIGNRLPWIAKPSYFTQLFGAEVEYDYEARTIRFLL